MAFVITQQPQIWSMQAQIGEAGGGHQAACECMKMLRRILQTLTEQQALLVAEPFQTWQRWLRLGSNKVRLGGSSLSLDKDLCKLDFRVLQRALTVKFWLYKILSSSSTKGMKHWGIPYILINFVRKNSWKCHLPIKGTFEPLCSLFIYICYYL